ncbi:MAG: hypothetical protein AW07_03160 [Candidatus Accumulibacter sp. SK-11]|nr:MAG: hypothetical protein AW07_03160 [Candidatus Accumulibacter sp. SK-11]
MTVDTPPMVKAMTVSRITGPSPALGRRAVHESQARLSHQGCPARSCAMRCATSSDHLSKASRA